MCESTKGGTMNNQEINKYLTEAMGECWHEGPLEGRLCSCGSMWLHCLDMNIDFFTWEGFGKLKEWAEVQKWWGDFQEDTIMWLLVNPERFATAIYEFLKERENVQS